MHSLPSLTRPSCSRWHGKWITPHRHMTLPSPVATPELSPLRGLRHCDTQAQVDCQQLAGDNCDVTGLAEYMIEVRNHCQHDERRASIPCQVGARLQNSISQCPMGCSHSQQLCKASSALHPLMFRWHLLGRLGLLARLRVSGTLRAILLLFVSPEWVFSNRPY